MTGVRSIPNQAGKLLATGVRKYSVLYLLILTFVVFGVTDGSLFLSAPTIKIVLGQQAVDGVLALAVLVPLTAGVFDLSVGAMLGFALCIITVFVEHHVMSAGLAAVVAVLMCACLGGVNGFLIVRFNINSFIATLATSQILTAAALLISANQQISPSFPASYQKWGQTSVLGLPIVIFYTIVLAAILWWALEHTPLGRRLYATGSNEDAARLSGVPTKRLAVGSLIASAVIAALAGVIYSAQVGVFDNSFGAPQLFPAFAAVFLGATQIKSRPNVWGTILAVFTLAFGVEGLTLTVGAADYWISPAFNGVALAVAVAFASRRPAVKFKEESALPGQDESSSGDGVGNEPVGVGDPPA